MTMKRSFLAFTLAAACASSALTGCAQVNAARDWLIDPKTQAAAKVVGSGLKVFICGLSEGSRIALQVEQAGQTKGQTATGMVLVGSSGVCAALGGVTRGSEITKGGEVVVTAMAAAS